MAILVSSYFIYNSVGSIDENALQNLSLVINLTKHIHLKSHANNDDIDPEEYAPYFPTFMWVIRDFALQLVDQEGETISSKDYLEKALAGQKGFSESVENKNRIRRLLKSYFKERDCCTMIRPLTEEDQLQNLEKMELDELRAEFVEQVMQLRRKVLNRVKPKTLNGQPLNGEMLFDLLHAYVDAINHGVVPNIENAWSYICKNECQKAMTEALKMFDQEFRENFEMKCPMYEDELRELYKNAKVEASEYFKKRAVGDASKDYIEDLKIQFRQKYSTYRAENENLARNAVEMYLQNTYGPIEEKLRNQDFPGFYEFENDVRCFS